MISVPGCEILPVPKIVQSLIFHKLCRGASRCSNHSGHWSRREACHYFLKAMQMGVPWILFDSWSNNLKVLYVTEGRGQRITSAFIPFWPSSESNQMWTRVGDEHRAIQAASQGFKRSFEESWSHHQKWSEQPAIADVMDTHMSGIKRCLEDLGARYSRDLS